MTENKIDDGGPAFPGVMPKDILFDHGLTKREWYAGMALQGLLASLSTELTQRELREQAEKLGHPEGRTEWTVAKCAYDYAAAMLAAGKEKT